MDGATIQAKVYYGYAQAAQRVGLPHAQFRPSQSPSSLPLDRENYVGTINAGMAVATAAKFNFERPALETDYKFACLADGTLLQIGDYLQLMPELTTTYFIGAMDPLMPIIAIRCNALTTIRRRAARSSAPGLQIYSGPTEAGETELLTGIPAAITLTSSGRNTRGGTLPSDAPGPIKYSVLLSPLTEASMIAVDDFVVDDAGRRFMISGFEKTPIALRLDTIHMVA